MEPRVIDDLIKKIRHCVETHALNKPGQYARWLWGDRNLGLNEYGCADAANILYTIGAFPSDPIERQAWVETLQSMQNPETGLFSEPTHHTIHTTAHCTAALELFDATPLYPCKALDKYTTKEGLYALLEQEVNWQKPWPESHKGAGILAALTNTAMVDLTWKNWYFDWMWNHSDPENGFFYGGKGPKTAHLYEYMAGGFHYLFNHESEHRPLRYPETMIDSCLYLIRQNWIDPTVLGFSTHLALIRYCTFIDIDVVYCLTRAMRQTPHRFQEGKECLELYAEKYLEMLDAIDVEQDEAFNDLHMLFGAVCCLAELQSALPGKLLSAKSLRLVLDRRPFI